MNDAEIVARWTREAVDQGLTEAQVRYVLAELVHYATLRDGRTGVEVSAVDGVWQSDALIDEELRARLRDAVRVLEEVPEAERDWHPGSDGQVLDLVHPSLFCLVREASGGPERAWRNPTDRHSTYEFSEKFQWLPTDVDVSDDGEVTFRSYVNNVHPELHRELLSVLPDLFARLRPLLEDVLTDLRHPRPLRIEADPYGWYDSEPEPPNRSSYPDDETYAEARRAWAEAQDDWWENRRPVIPDAPAFTMPEPPDASARVDLRGRRLQVIVKLATIHLTPEKPEYPGGSWHVEGILAFFLVDPSETIVSTSDVPPQQPWSDTSTMTLAQARDYREQLMRERKFFVDEHNEQLYEREFSLCEH
ncbi:DUF4246 family protein [Streptomyces sp. NPDC029216]|uniref:DUF4246 family protein n=1 Tax=Streptomyces sp. NPDC029216 TaxID=3154701 RepID=UPI0033F82EB4